MVEHDLAMTNLAVAEELHATLQQSMDAREMNLADAPLGGRHTKRPRLVSTVVQRTTTTEPTVANGAIAAAFAAAVHPVPTDTGATGADATPFTLTILPTDEILIVLLCLDARNLARAAATCRYLRDLVESALRLRAATRGRTCPDQLPVGFSSHAAHLAWLECRRDEAWAPVAAGELVSFFVADDGRLMSCGQEANSMGVVTSPTPLLSIHSVAIGCEFNVAISAECTVYTWGRGDEGSLGHGNTADSPIPKQVQALTGHRVLTVAAGLSHCLAVTEMGEVFSWGWDNLGQCGHGSISGPDQLLPRRVEALANSRARNVSAGYFHSLVVTEVGTVYAFGCGNEGQLGHNCFDRSSSPNMVDALHHVRIASTASGPNHSLALAEDGTVFSWGYNALTRRLREPLPQRVEALYGLKVSSVFAGGSLGTHISGAVTTAGELFTWGMGRHGQLGHGDFNHQLAPRRVDALRGERVLAVSIGQSHTIAVAHGGSMFGWGKANHIPDTECVSSPVRYTELRCACAWSP